MSCAAAKVAVGSMTVVGTGERAPLRFNTHTRADAVVILNAAATMSFKLSVGMPALS